MVIILFGASFDFENWGYLLITFSQTISELAAITARFSESSK